jgi:hypothetical protein
MPAGGVRTTGGPIRKTHEGHESFREAQKGALDLRSVVGSRATANGVATMPLTDALKDDSKRATIIQEAVKLVDDEVASKSGIGGFAVRKGYDAIKGVKPGFVPDVLQKLLPDFAAKVEPLWSEGKSDGSPTGFFEKHRGRVADALLSVTDGKIDGAKSSVVRSTYSMLRGSAKKHVEDAVPRLAKLLAKYD